MLVKRRTNRHSHNYIVGALQTALKRVLLSWCSPHLIAFCDKKRRLHHKHIKREWGSLSLIPSAYGERAYPVWSECGFTCVCKFIHVFTG